ncbi:MAG TPA: dihydrodipicolinate synthase family protein [Spirochaetales bacterium]|nr:dihydrodipicolinate synthase family protein [Spirochaetales bacterium]HRY55700.1 dihydrodipicolinate synthase family protein [Spirochaetia bacterium]HRZ64422.1 dihydrodipicolinate synthase family protein [Spirochaetia bacterium]
MTDEASARRLEGVIVALATPLGPDCRIDLELLARQVEWASGYGVRGAIVRHFRELAAAASSPLIAYNIPGNTHNPMTAETILEIADTENVAGIKDSSGDFATFSRAVLSGARGPFAWIQGEDLLDAAAYLVGAGGVVSGLSNVSVEPYVAMARAAAAGDVEGVREAQRAINALFRLVAATGGGRASPRSRPRWSSSGGEAAACASRG